MKTTRIGLIGDFDPTITAHDAINRSVALYRQSAVPPFEAQWINTREIIPNQGGTIQDLAGIWCVPGSPYQNTLGALWAIQLARTRLIPFLGTCGGFQHALLEYVRNVLGMPLADHEELNPLAESLLLTRLQCSLVEKSENLVLTGPGKFGKYYASATIIEEYHCNFGLNPAYEPLFQSGPLRVAASAANGEVRAVELAGHPFFVATLFQPERRAMRGDMHPLVKAFFAAAHGHAQA